MSKSTVWQSRRPILFAHRGGNIAGRKKENTFEAFDSAYNAGCRFFETDVILTKDGNVISYHGSQNAFMKRYSGLEKRKALQGLTYNQINDLLHRGKNKVPLLEDLFKRFPDCYFSVDAKTKEVTRPLAKIIKKMDDPERVSVTSFRLRRSIELSELIGGKDQNMALCLFRIISHPISWFPGLPMKYLSSKGIKSLHVPHGSINKKLIDSAHKYGIYIYAWSVNDQKEIKRLLSLKVDGIISDDIKLLLKTAK